ncbi:hypothetical protein P872_24425 [Rhodonellum psychrophilum GCM71 = DSM 17998]|uniref:Glycosyl hydrolase family 32 n=2 Tax=Rhodonellum TaxID=336827 RepID=U5C3C8_9BACT|nr:MULTISPECIES: glycoside hydrolase family 32 protein [Rhodonellum]ERM84568.1 hypothetical protein P872_24425 [Rhodonellum psychrophilum GCM71 = DSM 17998]SDY85389.1 fructan beta-fructosidase [Rhodonellum ikkaensis]
MIKHFTNILTLVCLVLVLSCNQQGSQLVNENTKEFNEAYRPQFHFSPPSQWMNDPNGMVYLDGEYHLFYQYYPDSTIWGPMHWGHAISEDMVHWEHMPVALFPDEFGYIFSGSAVVDHNNTSGLGTSENPAMVAIYTYHDPEGEKAKRDDYQTQGIAYSTDRGRTWTKHENNPILKNPGIKDFRDPKVSWVESNDGTGQWIMALAVLDRISFYSSPNLIDWAHESDFNPSWGAYGGVWECPDLFPLTTADGEVKWVLFVSINPGGPNGGSATQYFIGDFDGSNFNVESNEVKWLDYGADNYAGVTWSNIPKADGRKLMIGWMSNWLYANVVPTENWRSAMTVPRSLELIKKGNDFLVASKPIKELEKLRSSTETVKGENIALREELVELELIPKANDFSIEFSNAANEKVLISKKGDVLTFDRSQSGKMDFSGDFGKIHQAPIANEKIQSIRIFLDRSSLEIFVNGGELVLTEILFPNSPYNKVTLIGFENESKLHYLKSIW